MIQIKIIDAQNAGDVNLPNEPFEIWGRMIPSLIDGKWSYRTEQFDCVSEMCFPDFSYDMEDHNVVFIGAYENSVCIGLAVLRRDMFKYLYLDDLKVNRAFRGKGRGCRLLEACMEQAEKMDMQGVYTIGQDNNLSACLFYLAHGFSIGGFNNRSYRGTSQEGKSDLYFYRDC